MLQKCATVEGVGGMVSGGKLGENFRGLNF